MKLTDEQGQEYEFTYYGTIEATEGRLVPVEDSHTLGYNQALSDCLEVINKLLGETK